MTFPTERQPRRTVTFPDVTVLDLAAIRALAERMAGQVGVDETRASRFALAVGEIVANAVEHGHGPRAVTITGRTDRVDVEVNDQGPGFVPPGPASPVPDPNLLRGRGLWLARQWSDDLDILSGPAGSTVWLTAVVDD
jgi:serine/threonine-protein kinase RsbW